MFWGGRQGTHLYLTGSPQEELELRFVEDDDDTGDPQQVKLKESPAGGLKSELGIMQWIIMICPKSLGSSSENL